MEVSTEVKHLWRKMFVKDMLLSYLAADSCTTEFACSYREHVQRFGGPTAPSTDSRIKEFGSATWDGE